MTEAQAAPQSGHEAEEPRVAQSDESVQQEASQAQAAPEQSFSSGRANVDEQGVAAAAAQVMAEGESAPQVASLDPALLPKEKISSTEGEEKDEKELDGEGEEPVSDLALAPESDILATIAAADGARVVPGGDGEASLLGDDGDGGAGVLLPVLAVGAIAAGAVILVESGEDEELEIPEVPANGAPEITTGATAAIDENVAAGTVVYDAAATDPDGDTITFSLSGTDASLFTIDASTGEVSLVDSPDFEAQDSYSFNVVATDAAGATDTQAVTLTVNDIDEAPEFGDGDTEVAFDENVPVGTPVVTPGITDPEGGDVTVELGGDDADAFVIDPETGAVLFAESPDFEAQESYSFTLTATDEAGNETTQTYTVSINDLDDGPTVVNLDASDDDGNPLTPVTIDAGGGDFLFTDDVAEPSNTILLNVGEGDQIELTGVFGISTSADDPSDLELSIAGPGGTTNVIIVKDVLPDDAFVFDEASAEAAIGFDLLNFA